MPDKFQNKYRIASARLSTWDYGSNAAYFITICTANRQHYFGEIINGEMQLSKVGEIANECWMNIPAHFSHFYLDAFIIMPNHVHGIVVIDKPYSVETGQVPIVETGYALSLPQSPQPNTETELQSQSQPPHFRFRNQGKNTISSMVGSFKSAVTKRCNENNLLFGWQSRFHDHIIRNKDEFQRIRNYIINNPKNWKDDRWYS